MRGVAILSMVSSALASISYGSLSSEPTTFNTTNGVCGDSTWNMETLSYPATIESCKALAKYARSVPSAGWLLKGWGSTSEGFLWTMCTDYCVFEVRMLGGQVAPISFIDLADVTHDAIEKFGNCTTGTVAAYGVNK
ncbi:hypothetical protein F5Y08DRAFT_343625 [Xylaria arbuscula]|nr:hypothetical protein F5Y08DRAFT_343625 [Xylaria arbuscula]